MALAISENIGEKFLLVGKINECSVPPQFVRPLRFVRSPPFVNPFRSASVRLLWWVQPAWLSHPSRVLRPFRFVLRLWLVYLGLSRRSAHNASANYDPKRATTHPAWISPPSWRNIANTLSIPRNGSADKSPVSVPRTRSGLSNPKCVPIEFNKKIKIC